MGMIDLVGFRQRFPEFVATTDDTVNFWITEADSFFDQTRWEDLLTSGSAYWVAHNLKLAADDAANPLLDDATMKKVGDIAKSRDPKLIDKQTDNPYMRTKYGQRYMYYAKLVGIGATAV
jgi:hypothetical protein